MALIDLNVKIDEDVKQKAQTLFKKLGLDLETAINIFLRQSIRERGIPFHVYVNRSELNSETLKAVEDAEKGIGLSRPFSSTEELTADLEADEPESPEIMEEEAAETSDFGKGLWQGLYAEGFVIGFTGSYVKSCADTIRNLSQEKQWTLEQVMDLLHIAPVERKTYQNILKGVYRDQTETDEAEMDNLGQDIWNRSFEEGFAEVHADSIRSLSKKMQWTLEQAMIMLEIPENEQQKYKDLL